MKVNKLFLRIMLCAAFSFVLFMTGCEEEAKPVEKKEPLVDKEDIHVGLVKREFRAVWVPTVGNYDFPTSRSETAFRREFNAVLDTIERYNMNAVIFHVSPILDAWWDSELNPWSRFLTGYNQGDPPGGTTIWDPMRIMLDLSHERGIEFHAWLNPYRAAASYGAMQGNTIGQLDAMTVPELIDVMKQNRTLADNNFAVLNPETVYRGRKVSGTIGTEYRSLYLDPSFDKVHEHINAVVNELLTKYPDLSVIHYDDYFYPYDFTYDNGGKEALADSWARVLLEEKDKYPYDAVEYWEQWLRDNNDRFVREVQQTIRDHNKRTGSAVRFGISPIGVWARSDVPGGLSLPGATSFAYKGGVYADFRKWVLNEMCDYLVPQVYWAFENTYAPYDTLTEWLIDLHKDKNVHLYMGHGPYQFTNDPVPAGFVGSSNANQILRQLQFNRLRPTVKGSVFYTYQNFTRSGGSGQTAVLSQNNAFIREYWYHKALLPEMPWLNDVKPAAPQNVTRSGKVISWNDTSDTQYYVVYRVTTSTFMSEESDYVVQDPTKILAKVWREENKTKHSFTDTTESPGQYTYYVTAVSNTHLESLPSLAAK